MTQLILELRNDVNVITQSFGGVTRELAELKQEVGEVKANYNELRNDFGIISAKIDKIESEFVPGSTEEVDQVGLLGDIWRPVQGHAPRSVAAHLDEGLRGAIGVSDARNQATEVRMLRPSANGVMLLLCTLLLQCPWVLIV